jgi:FkbM family methyltransferase
MTLSYLMHRIFYRTIIKKADLNTFGNKCSWTIVPSLTHDSFVVSGGAGDDISFEIEIGQRFGCEIYLFDPSDAGRATFEKTVKPDNLHFFLEGLHSMTGSSILHKPNGNPQTMSWTMSGQSEGVAIPTRNLKSILADSGRQKIDLLKIDIEGFEYPVLHAAIDDQVPIDQICVEIHQGSQFDNKTRIDRWALIFKLLQNNYRLVHHVNWDHTFVHKNILADTKLV